MKPLRRLFIEPWQAKFGSVEIWAYVAPLLCSQLIMVVPYLTFQGKPLVYKAFFLTPTERYFVLKLVLHKASSTVSSESLLLTCQELTILQKEFCKNVCTIKEAKQGQTNRSCDISKPYNITF